jgi:membrane-associated protein
MDTLMQLLDFILHVDRYLETFVTQYGAWVYALLFLIIFVETGLVVMPFLPGDSLLFVVGTLCGTGLLSLPLTMALLVVAAIAGDQLNYRDRKSVV